jgi:hypothetical protein
MGTIRFGNWATANMRYDVSTSIAAWDGVRRAAGAGGEVERRFAADRVTVAAGGRAWRPLGSGQPFQTAHLLASLRTDGRNESPEPAWVALAAAGAVAVSAAAPLSEWPTPGDPDPRAPRLRAHPFTHHGVIDSPAFGRRLAFSSVEGRRWLVRVRLVRVGVAAFVDTARVSHRFQAATTGAPQLGAADAARFLVDAGIGVRFRWPGRDATLRVDYGEGLRDRDRAVTVAFVRD